MAEVLFAAEASSFWQWRPHPQVWILVASVIALGVYVVRVIGPKVTTAGGPVVTRRQRGFFWAGVVVLWLSSDWPMHDVGEQYLYSVHMIQHFMITMLLPPLFLLAIPEWLGRLVIGDGKSTRRVIAFLTRPVVAGIIFNAVVAFTHWSAVVQFSVDNGGLHYLVHLAAVLAALLMWVPVVGPIPELRISLPGQMVYLFLMSVIPTIPAAWLAIAEGVVYDAYDHSERMFGLSVTEDQQLAGFFMKIVAGFYLWGIIGYLFFKWSGQLDPDEPGKTDRNLLTFEESGVASFSNRRP